LTCGTKIDASNQPGNVPAKVTGFSRVFNPKLSKQENISALKVALSEGHPVVIGMGLPQSFYAIGENGLFEPKQDDAKFIADYGGHAMAVIGYDDERFGGTFEIVNSWGR
jgi:C1A family cysteine protease